jgi:CheY-like chemotaxis protein
MATGELSGIRVLVVDDEADARELLALTLQQCGAKVTAAGSASEALELLRGWRPHVLVSDIGMPGEDGYTLMRRVRSLAPEAGGEIPAAAVTGFASSEDRRKALAAGYQVHMVKPVGASDLAAVVASLVKTV